MTNTKLVTLHAFLIIGLAASSVHAKPERAVGHVNAPPQPTAGKLDNGKISLTELVPPITKVADYSGDFRDRSTLFGDLGGRRTWLYDKGFTLDAQLTQVYQGVTSGGAEDNGNAQYNGLLEINSTLDTAKMNWWSGGLISATVMSNWGTPLTTEAGNLSPVNMTPLWPIPFDQSTEVTEYYLTQAFPNKMTLLIGRLDATNYLDKNSFANNPESQFLNASLNNDLMWGAMLSFSTYAAMLIAPITTGVNLAVAAWDPETLQWIAPGIESSDDAVVSAPGSLPDFRLIGSQMIKLKAQAGGMKS